MNSRPEPTLLDFWPQCGFLAFFCLALYSALWMQGDSRIASLAVLTAVGAMALSRLSFHAFPYWMRICLQCLIVGLSFLWLLRRWPQVPMDLSVCEAASILLSALFLGRTLSDHLVLWGACIGLLAFSSMNATRSLFVLFFIPAMLCSVLLLYATRTQLLALARSTLPVPPTQGQGRHCSIYWWLHLALVAVFTIFFIRAFTSLPHWNTMGLVPVSFRAMQSQTFPGNFQDWFTDSNQYEEADAGQLIDEALQNGNPLLDPNAASLANLPDAPGTSSQGTGAGLAIGTDLVLQAFSNAKLYWMVQCYDLFDGTTWSRSPQLDSGANPFDRAMPDRFATVVQKITLYKPTSNLIPYAYAPRWLNYASSVNGATPSAKAEALLLPVKYLNYKIGVAGDNPLPKLPWHYTVVSNIALTPDELVDPATLPPRQQTGSAFPPPPPPDARGYYFQNMLFTGTQRNFFWRRRTPWGPVEEFEKLYLQIPEGVVSPRMADLAKSLTEKAKTDLDKALILRNYLRTNYLYTLQPSPVPAGAMPLDYFLFESKEGFCQHFAQALVFLARSIGLRSRLVTGYSPGNFNVLSNCYEVYEYHAHAWTQIFIERYGWLTFDGTPPGSLDLRNTPNLLAASRNAFDKTWTPNIPELAFTPSPGTAVFSRTNPNGWSRSGRPLSRNSLPSLIAHLFGYTPAVKATPDTGGDTTDEPPMTRLDRLAQSAAATFGALLDLLQRVGDRLLQLREHPFRLALGLCAVAALATAAWLSRRSIGRRLRRWYHRHACRKALKRLLAMPREAAAQRIEASMALADSLMDYCNCPRRLGDDAMEHATLLATTAPALQPDFQHIAQAALQNHFANRLPSDLADATVEAVEHLSLLTL